mmetsp:Transcript_14580/g.12382  ORF Transcript_14580/g.12382 Transcript_14580/m.12382 type:complete len:182 (+) Transcript_14580:46-591(+)
MAEFKISPHINTQMRFSTQKNLRSTNLKFRINRLIDENQVLKNDDKHLEANNTQLLICAQVFTNQRAATPERTTKLIKRMFMNEDMELPIKISHLNYNSIVALTIWSLDRKYESDKPIGGTIFSIFDQNLRMREGKINLLVWPDRLPDTSNDSKTPGIVSDPNIDDLNFYNKKLEKFERNF